LQRTCRDFVDKVADRSLMSPGDVAVASRFVRAGFLRMGWQHNGAPQFFGRCGRIRSIPHATPPLTFLSATRGEIAASSARLKPESRSGKIGV
jgi:hypothetical protein